MIFSILPAWRRPVRAKFAASAFNGAARRNGQAFSYPWPKVAGCDESPVWTGQGFRVGEEQVGLLSYRVEQSNWTDELTEFHEESAGDRHFIDRASRRHAVHQIRKYVKRPAPVILEVGCASGFLLRDLRSALPDAFLIGSDYIRGPLDALSEKVPDLPLLQFDLVQCPLPSDSLDAVVLLNVLEHVEDHEGAVRQLFRILKPGGVVVIEVPAGPHLYDVYDKVLMHWRRYTLKELVGVTSKVGFRTLMATHLGFFVYPAFSWVKKSGKRLLAEPPDVQKAWVAKQIKGTGSNPLLHGMMLVEQALGKVLSYPCGLRCLVTCAKPA